MKVFLSYKYSAEDSKYVDQIISEINNKIKTIEFVSLENDITDWKKKAYDLIKSSDVVLFFIGKDTHDSSSVNIEYEIVSKLQKRFYFTEIKYDNPKYRIMSYPYFCFDNRANHVGSYCDEIIDTLCYIDVSKDVLLEQYKILFSSTENVSSRRQNVNNLYFGLITTIITASFLAANEIVDKVQAALLLVLFSLIALMISLYWKRLVISYQLLNKGKFCLLYELEDRLKINMSRREWNILEGLKYSSNTITEKKVVSSYIVIIYIFLFSEIIYLLWRLNVIKWQFFDTVLTFFHLK